MNVVFHSPEGDKKRIGPSDAIIAFRWLLNKRDITHVVAPEDGEEISLESIAKRITQLVVKNSARFERQQKAAQAERKELEETREAVKDAEERQSALMEQVSAKAKETETIEARLSNTLSLLEKQKTINAELQAKIDALRRAKPGGGTGGTSGDGKGKKGDTAGNGSGTPHYARDLRDILDGKYDADSGKVLDLLEQAITAAESDGKLEEFQALLDAASNHLTDLLAKEAA